MCAPRRAGLDAASFFGGPFGGLFVASDLGGDQLVSLADGLDAFKL